MVFDIIEHLQIRPELKESILEFRKQYPVEPQFQSRIPVPSNIYYGTDIWERAVTALLCGKNILLVGHKATGKNILRKILPPHSQDRGGMYRFMSIWMLHL